ncbi:MAG: hypothetical protein GX633_09335, partial [Clostridiales bacterium]|nr:hypothetical protein [Clostridiales bacterium]
WSLSNPSQLVHDILLLLDRYGQSYIDSLPISADGNGYTRDKESGDKLKKILEKHDIKKTLSPRETFDELSRLYKVPEEYTREERRRIVGVLYDMERANFSAINPFTIASNVDMELVSIINEDKEHYTGAKTVTVPVREYKTEYAAHILGRVGPIFAEEYEEYAAKGYAMNARVGKDGVEKAFEDYLKGTSGTTTYNVTKTGKTLDIVSSQPAFAGNNVYLTLDIRLQEATERALQEHITRINAEKVSEGLEAECDGGAAVMIGVNTGDILACASYPTFDIKNFSRDYASLISNEAKPLFNRAISGTYPPGSVFKMVSATAALQSGIITPETEIVDYGVYTYYKPYTYRCWLYSDYGMTHGTLNVSGAIKHSCNYFFYETARLMGIDTITEYASRFGLGEYTGIELSNEAKGVVAGPKERKKAGGSWYAGDTLIAAIGQSDHLFTPLQLANYVATIANGGTRYKAHLLNAVVKSDNSEMIFKSEPTVANKIDYTEENHRAVLDGMLSVTEDGTASKVFADYGVKVVGKTGSAQVGSGSANGVFVLAAPYEDPEVAIAVLVEHGGSGNNVAWIARDMLTAYFDCKEALSGEYDNTLLR